MGEHTEECGVERNWLTCGLASLPNKGKKLTLSAKSENNGNKS